MDVVVDISRKVVVDNVRDVGDIETTSGNSSGDQDGATAIAEHLQGTLTLTLSAVTVNRSGREVLVDEEVGKRVRHALGLDEDQGKTGTVGVQNVQEDGALVDVLDVLDLLGDVLGGGANTTDRQEDVILQEVASKHLDIAGESGREHERLAVLDAGHVLTLNNTTNLGLETHVKHAISLVKDKVLDVAEGDATTLYEVDQSARGGNKKIAATLDLTKLRADVSATVDDARTNPGPVGKLPRLVVDLRDKLTGRSEDERGRIGLALTSKATALATRNSRGSLDECLRKDGEEESTSLAGTGLGASHEIAAAHDDGNRVLLDRSRHSVASQLDVRDEVVIQRRVGEVQERLRNIVARSLDGNVVVLLEVDAGVLLRRVLGGSEQIALETGISGARDVLAVAPLAITRAARI